MTEVPDEAPGWTALDMAFEGVFTAQEPLHYAGTALPDQGIQGISVFSGDDYWFLVTIGMSELFAKVSGDPAVSGWGIELTIRVPYAVAEDEPPAWASNLLHRLAEYVDSTGKVFGPGHRMDPGGPITGAEGTRLTAVAFAPDPELPPIDTPNGRVEFVTVVGITAGELSRMQRSSTATVLAELADRDPLLVTDPAR